MESWKDLIQRESEKAYFKDRLIPFLEAEYASETVYPRREAVFRALVTLWGPMLGSEAEVLLIREDLGL